MTFGKFSAFKGGDAQVPLAGLAAPVQTSLTSNFSLYARQSNILNASSSSCTHSDSSQRS